MSQLVALLHCTQLRALATRQNCANIQSLLLPSSVTTIDQEAFDQTALVAASVVFNGVDCYANRAAFTGPCPGTPTALTPAAMQANTEATLTFACTPRSTASPQPVYFKLVDGSSCDAMGRSDAEYNAALQAPLTFIDQPGTMGVLDGVLTATISTPSNTLIVCYYMGTSPETGSYERLGSATFVVLPATVVTGLSNQSSPLTLIVGRPAQEGSQRPTCFPLHHPART